MKKKKIICFDLDNVVCTTKRNNYKCSKPIQKSINLINKLYSQGYQIIIFTARGMGRFNGNYNMVVKFYRQLTLKQLRIWTVNYQLLLGKPAYDYFIDDKAYGFKKNWHDDFCDYL
jgi:histidinol phosphatase-like enzyme